MIKKVLSTILLLSFLTVNTVLADNNDITVDQFKGLIRNPSPAKIADGAHTRFDNVYIKDQNVQAVKGRQRLNSAAHADPVVNGFFYYRNRANTVEKLIVAESDEIVSYDLDGTNRTSLASGLTNSSWNATQIGDTLYLTNETDGIYKYTGGGSATAITGVTAPSSVDFVASTATGGCTSGLDCIAVCQGNDTSEFANGDCTMPQKPTGTVATNDQRDCEAGFICYNDQNGNGGDVAGTCSNLVAGAQEVCLAVVVATNTIYQYKVAKYSSILGIESEPSSADSATLSGGNVLTAICETATTDTIVVSGKQTSTTGTLAAAPSAPFDSYRVYRTVASGSDYFLLGDQSTGTYTDGKPDESLDAPLDKTIDTIEDPDFKYIEAYKGTIFVAENSTLRFTRVPIELGTDTDKYWLETDKLSVGTSRSKVTGLAHTANSLLIFTTNSIQELTGFGVGSFRLSTLIDGVGTVSNKSVVTDVNGDIIFFAGKQGVYKLSVGQQATDTITGAPVGRGDADLVRISSPDLDSVFNGTDSEIVLLASDYANANAYYDLDNNLYHLYIGSDEFIFDALHSTWSHVKGVKTSASLFIRQADTTGKAFLIDDLGFFYRNWIGYTTGVPSGTVTGAPTASTNSTLTDTLATFYTTDDKLKGQWIVLDNGTTLQYRRISTNTSTEITVESNWTINPVTTDTYYIGYIIPDILTKQYNPLKAPNELQVQYFNLVHNKSNSTQNLTLKSFREKGTSYDDIFTFDLSSRFVDKFGTDLRSPWTQWQLRTFIYNTSDTIDNPLDIENYTIEVVNKGHA